MIYECHITFDVDNEDYIKTIKSLAVEGWKFSRIHGDPVLGDKLYTYLSAHNTEPQALFDAMMVKVEKASELNVQPCRLKIEAIVYDERL